MRLRTRIMNLLEKILGPPSSNTEGWLCAMQWASQFAAAQSQISSLQSVLTAQKTDQKRALELLEGVLCDPEGNLSLGPPWSVGDLANARMALEILRGKRPDSGIVIQHDGAQFKAVCKNVAKQIREVNQAFMIPKEELYTKPPIVKCEHRLVACELPSNRTKCTMCGEYLTEPQFVVTNGSNPEMLEPPCDHRSEDGPDGEVQCMDCGMIVGPDGEWMHRP